MAMNNHNHHNKHLQIHHLPQSQYIDSVRWLPSLSPLSKLLIFSLYNPTTSSTTLQIHSLNPPTTNPPFLSPLSTLPSPSLSRTSSLKPTPSLITLSTFSGSLHFLTPKLDPSSGRVGLEECGTHLEAEEGFHVGPIECVDVLERESSEGVVGVVSVGEDGRVNLVRVGEGGTVGYTRVFDGDGLVAFTAVKWASRAEFVTGGLGCCLQWWDQRRKFGEPTLQFKGSWSQKAASVVVHSLDIHPSRKHTCMAGGSSGTVFAWDLRWPKEPIILSGDRQSQPISGSDVWEVQFDCHLQSNTANSMSSSMLPVMMCSEDGILAVLEPGAEPIELLEEPCAINGFDIDKQNHSDVVCSLEWESIAILSRS